MQEPYRKETTVEFKKLPLDKVLDVYYELLYDQAYAELVDTLYDIGWLERVSVVRKFWTNLEQGNYMLKIEDLDGNEIGVYDDSVPYDQQSPDVGNADVVSDALFNLNPKADGRGWVFDLTKPHKKPKYNGLYVQTASRPSIEDGED